MMAEDLRIEGLGREDSEEVFARKRTKGLSW